MNGYMYVWVYGCLSGCPNGVIGLRGKGGEGGVECSALVGVLVCLASCMGRCLVGCVAVCEWLVTGPHIIFSPSFQTFFLVCIRHLGSFKTSESKL